MQLRVIVYGSGGNGIKYYQQNKDNHEIIAFADSYKNGELFGLPIISPNDIKDFDFDMIVIASIYTEAIKKTLLEIGIEESKIDNSYTGTLSDARDNFLIQLSKEIKRKNLRGSVAEAGVFRGDFAAQINKNFPQKLLYLFDTFEGFDKRDIMVEEGYEANPSRGEYFKQTSIEIVLSKMDYKENVIIKKGYIPETLQDVNDEFCFVNLDMDLYQPTLEALKWFWPRMVSGGVILIHDYFEDTGTYPNLKKAVIKFTEEFNVPTMPIGDNLSIALIKA